jgi:transposase
MWWSASLGRQLTQHGHEVRLIPPAYKRVTKAERDASFAKLKGSRERQEIGHAVGPAEYIIKLPRARY